MIRIEQLSVTVSVESEGGASSGEAAFARLFAKYARAYAERARRESERAARLACERRIGGRGGR